jgi:hypothetical protein
MLKYDRPEVLFHEFLNAALNEIELSISHYESFDVGQGPTAHFGLEAVWANSHANGGKPREYEPLSSSKQPTLTEFYNVRKIIITHLRSL